MVDTIYIKNMVCPRCIAAVSRILEEFGIPYTSIKLGEVELTSVLSLKEKDSLSLQLQDLGFRLINDRKSQIIEQMKNLVIDKVHYSKDPLNITWADYIRDELHLDYKYVSSLFSSIESITLEHYIIQQKIERIKELIVYDELNLSQIAYQLDYSSVAYLSNQFKKITGMTPTQFKNSIMKNRRSLDQI